MENVVIIGGGCAGFTASIYTARANLEPKVLLGEEPGGLLSLTTSVENFPGFPEGIGGFDLTDAMRRQAMAFGAKMVEASVVELIVGSGSHKLKLSDGQEIESRAVIIATGSKPRWLGVPGEKELRNKGVSSCATCDGALFRKVPVVVVGGGDTALEDAMFLSRFASKVTILHRREELRASKILQDRTKNNPKIEFRFGVEVNEILGREKVEGVIIKDSRTGLPVDKIDCQAVFVAIGHAPNTAIFGGKVDLDGEGYVKLSDLSSFTSVGGIFAAGDCADKKYRQAIHAAGMGCRAAIDVERWLSGS